MKIFEVFEPPFRYDHGSTYIMDKNNNICLDVRGCGLFQYLDRGDITQDQFGEWVADSLNKNIAVLNG